MDGLPTGNVVLMDSRRHKTMRFDWLTARIVVPVAVADGRTYFDLNKPSEIAFPTWCGRHWDAVFTATGSLLFGDPIFYQTSGPELPDTWWERVR